MFKKLQTRKDINLIVEEKLYEYVANEMEAGDIRQGLWAKALAQASSADEAEIRRKYIALRVELLAAEGRLQQQFIEELEATAEEAMTVEAAIPKPEISEDQVDSEAAFVRGTIVLLIIIVLPILFVLFGVLSK